jgi:hypothetical protein
MVAPVESVPKCTQVCTGLVQDSDCDILTFPQQTEGNVSRCQVVVAAGCGDPARDR